MTSIVDCSALVPHDADLSFVFVSSPSVIKNGEIVYENYHGRGAVNYTSNGYSSTKSSCSALYGIATQQGWADPMDKVADRNSNTRQCNSDATFQNVLTMTGRSRNINNPQFSCTFV